MADGVAADSANPFFAPWSTPFELPPFERIAPDHFRPAFDRALAAHKAEIAAIAEDGAAPTFANTVDAHGAERARAAPGVGRVLQPRRQPYQRRAAGDRARDVAASCPASQRDLHEPGTVCALRRAVRSARIARAVGRAGQGPRPLSHHLRARGRAARARVEEAARRDPRAPRHARHAVLAKRARRREGLHAHPRRRGRSRRPPGFPSRRGRARG